MLQIQNMSDVSECSYNSSCVFQVLQLVVNEHSDTMKDTCLCFSFTTLHCGRYQGKANGDILVCQIRLRIRLVHDHILHLALILLIFISFQITNENIIIPITGKVTCQLMVDLPLTVGLTSTSTSVCLFSSTVCLPIVLPAYCSIFFCKLSPRSRLCLCQRIKALIPLDQLYLCLGMDYVCP